MLEHRCADASLVPVSSYTQSHELCMRTIDRLPTYLLLSVRL